MLVCFYDLVGKTVVGNFNFCPIRSEAQFLFDVCVTNSLLVLLQIKLKRLNIMANDVEVVTNVAVKRPLEEENGAKVSRKKRKGVVNSADRNPVAILNELRSGLKYEVLDQQGPAHAPVFTIAVVVDSQQYIGTGRSKKVAKCKAAELALKSFIQFPNNCKVLSPNSSNNTKLDFTSDSFEANHNNSTDNDLTKSTTQRNPVMVLNELYPTAKYKCIENTIDLFATFKVIIDIDGETFIGTGSKKKMAKSAAAISALSKLLHAKPNEIHNFGTYRPSKITNEQQQWVDNVGRLISEKFTSLMEKDNLHARRKVLAGIVMNRDAQLEVISVATGTKCVSGEWMSMIGATLNDMHAEIVSRRCLQLFLYDQLLMLTQPDKAAQSIFEPNPEGRGYRLKSGIDFHLYINTAPCGDARIFCPADGSVGDKHPNKHNRGRLRTKIESGEGTIPVKNIECVQTWDGIIQGERLLTMSCSDKIARWNVLGIQGCLLAHFIEPIYLKSLILGSLFNESHLYRAICGRIENTLQGLSPPYKLNRPDMCLITSAEVRHTVKAPNYSVNWTIGQQEPEVVKTTTGRTETGISRVCKQVFAQKFVELCKSNLKPITEFDLNLLECYSDVKEMQSSYKSAKERLFEAFVKAGLGRWVQKPSEQDQFQLDIVQEEIKSEY